MPGSFQFSSAFTTGSFVSQTGLRTGAGNGIDNPSLFSSIGGEFLLNVNDAAIASVALQAGQTLNLDVDFGSSNNIDPINTQMWIVDATGKIVASNNNSAADLGSTGNADPKLQYMASQPGMFFVVVAQKDNDYIDQSFGFDNGGTDTGVFQLNMGIAGLPVLATGTGGDDYVSLMVSQRRYDGRGGDDYITAPLARSVINGGGGSDVLYGNERADILYGDNGNDSIYGYGDRDVLVGGNGTDWLYGGVGRDQLFGGLSNDSLYGEKGDDLLAGEEGDDNLTGGAGNDWLRGGDGNDYLYLDAGNDVIDGGGGSDTLYAYYGTGRLTVDLRLSTAQDTGSFGNDTIINIESVTGTNGFNDLIKGNGANNNIYGYGGKDRLFGLGGNDYLGGGEGNDFLYGGSGTDNLYGEAGNDKMYGHAGNDSLTGGGGSDQMWGGADGDHFYFNAVEDSLPGAADVIADFDSAEFDRIALYNVANSMVFRGSGPFQNTGGEVRVQDFTTFQRVYVNLDTDSTPEMVIKVMTSTPLVESDFYL